MSIVADLVLPSVAPEHVRKLLRSNVWGSDAGTLAIQTVKTQLENHEIRQNRRARGLVESKVPSLFDAAADKLAKSLEECPEDKMVSMEGLPPHLLSRVVWKLDNIPYYMFCGGKPFAEGEGDVDEWVLRNEIWLREFSATSEREIAAAPKHPRVDDSDTVAQNYQNTGWSRGLVRLSSHADVVFADSVLTDTCRTITRPESLPGFKVLDGRRSATVKIQPSVEMFAKTFETMTGGLLRGLNWDHVFVAGGIVLGSLLCTGDKDATNTPDQWESSDVDLYIHGLGPVEANKKIEYIFSVFKANLPKDAPVLVVRNSKTITFFSQYPLRRIQVVLKLVNSPKDVLLNFDLDICAIGWNGTEVYMLPRAARALETGYTVFTMDLINGHYLGDRRATQEQRVFKYADKGYGIRILPPYLEEHKIIINDETRRKKLGINRDSPEDLALENLLEKERQWMPMAIKGFRRMQGSVSVPTVSHSLLQEREQNTEDPPRRSVLSGFSIFMRHVVLWEYELAGLVRIERDLWAAPVYDSIYTNQFGVSYNDIPKVIGKDPTSENYLVEGLRTQRITHADSVHEILQSEHDIYLPVWLPKSFITFAETLVPDTVRASGVPSYRTNIFKPALKEDVPTCDADLEDLQLVIWRITSITMWQQLHRAIDEVHEVLWSFYYANAGLDLERDNRLKLLASQFARRAIRMTAADEYGAFAKWAARIPAGFFNYLVEIYRYLDQDPNNPVEDSEEEDAEGIEDHTGDMGEA